MVIFTIQPVTLPAGFCILYKKRLFFFLLLLFLSFFKKGG